MAEYIERETAKKVAERYGCANGVTLGRHSGLADCIASEIEALPSADVATVRHGRWILEREPDGKPYCFHCSVCDGDHHHIGIMTAYNFCPNCGAKMDLED